MLRHIIQKLGHLCCFHSEAKVKVTIHELKNLPKDEKIPTDQPVIIRIATFNAAMFLMAPAVSDTQTDSVNPVEFDIRGKSANDKVPVKGILRQHKFSVSKRRVSINLQEDEISLRNNSRGKSSVFGVNGCRSESMRFSEKSVLDVLKEVGADIIAIQNVKAEEEKGMKPLSDLAGGLGMKYVFAESWAPEYGNAILSKWPIKRSRVQKICDDSDFRNVLKATIDIPKAGKVNFHCTYLDHFDENWRMKQISAILGSCDEPHILAGGMNSLDETDYSAERWNDILKYNEEIGKPTPKAEVMKYLKGNKYLDAKNFAGECESVVVVAKGQDVQGTCKYGTRVDYILASGNAPYKFVQGSYGVVSSKGTSDHHIVKVDMIVDTNVEANNRQKQQKERDKDG